MPPGIKDTIPKHWLGSSEAFLHDPCPGEHARLGVKVSEELAITESILSHGEDSTEVERLRLEHAKAALRTRLEEQDATEAQIAKAEKLLETERQRRREIEAAAAQKQAGTLLANLAQEAELAEAILKYGRNSLEVQQLQIAAARAEFEEGLKTLAVAEETKALLREQWEATRGLNSADPFGRLAATQDILSRQNETLAQLKLEISLIGQSEAVRRRVLALYEAELEIRQRGLDTSGTYADRIREQAVAAAELRAELERQADAWGEVQSAAESAIDGGIDALLDGDFSGALEEVGNLITSTLTELAIKNPLKNALLGTELGTLQDVGGLGGIWNRLTGGDAAAVDPGVMARQAASMAVTTPMVTINAGTVSGLPSGLSAGAGGAGVGATPSLSTGGLSGPAGVQKQVWDYFRAKGLAPHQVAAIMGNASAESAFNPHAVGDGGTSFGLFQHHAGRGRGLLDAVGGKAGLGNVEA